MKKWWLPIIIILLIGFTVWNQVYKQDSIESTEEESEVNKEAIPFELMSLNNEVIQMKDYRGKKVFLNFWATWCTVCKKEMPTMQQFQEKYKSEVEIVAINFTSTEVKEEDVYEFIENTGVTFDVLLDRENQVHSAYGILTYPTTYFIDEKGMIVGKQVGELTEETMEESLNKMRKKDGI
ncbi:redoxin domain-containing protein [Bacillus carboniphilus]|uniref:Redoxin domain-containing protein n=1 Tax=Bacillus carboniphilus TaxID=86663 RepID=A0ABY9JYC3_9BACI|nr:redoxin domain-containing protein [Bacillus carboniphilus]WLR43440.1 redoxin domain-containing protein [Bacillus carboniphilus]